MNKEKKASVLIYSIVLTSIALVLALVVMNNHISLVINSKNVEIEKNFYRNIKSNLSIFGEDMRKVNSDGAGFIDNISCPGYSTGSSLITMSGTTKKERVRSTLFQSGSTVSCISDYRNKDLEIYFNDDYTGFSSARYDNQTINLNGTLNYSGVFNSDNTKITIPLSSYNKADGFDDNLNNDNYQSKITN